MGNKPPADHGGSEPAQKPLKKIRYLAFYDPLTRLPNRRLLMDRLQQALATVPAPAQWCLAAAGSGQLQDPLSETQGHDRGDTLLLQVSHRLRACVHEDDTVARQGGDEFVVVLEDLGDTREEAAARVEEAAQKILLALRRPYTLDGETHHSSLSMGITIFSGMRETVGWSCSNGRVGHVPGQVRWPGYPALLRSPDAGRRQ